MEKKYTSIVRNVTARPRSRRLRELGGGAAAGAAQGGVMVYDALKGDGHAHANKSLLDSLTLDGAGLLSIRSVAESDEQEDPAEVLTPYLPKKLFDELFEKVELAEGKFAIKAKMDLFSVGGLTALGNTGSSGDGSGTGGGSFDRLDAWADYASGKEGYVLSAKLGYLLHTDVEAMKKGAVKFETTGDGNAVTDVKQTGALVTVTKGAKFLTAADCSIKDGVIKIGEISITPLTQHQSLVDYLKSADAAATYQPKGNYLTQHQSLADYLKSADAAATYQPKGNYLTQHQSLADYLKSADAAATYQPKGNYLTQHQAIYALTMQAGTFSAVTFNPKSGAATVNIPTKTSHLTNDSSFVTASQMNTALATKLDKAAFDELFEKEVVDGKIRIKAKFNFYSVGGVSALGMGGATGGGSGSGGGASALVDLLDVNISNLAKGQMLQYNGTHWTNVSGIATEAYVNTRINNLINGAPAAYDTLKEIADVLQGNVNSIGDIMTALSSKADKSQLADYVTLGTAQTVTGVKTFKADINMSGTGDDGNRIYWSRNSDCGQIWFKNTADGDTDSYLGFQTGDNGNEYFRFSHKSSGATSDTVWATIKANGITAASFIKTGGTASQFLMADGSVKALSDITSAYVTALGTSGNHLTWTKNGAVNNITVPFATAASVLNSSGRLSAISNAKHGAGIRLYEAYGASANYPTNYGNVLAAQGNAAIGAGELLMGWSGSDGGYAGLYYRNCRDNTNTWSPWVIILDSSNFNNLIGSNLTAYVKKAGDTMTGNLNFSNHNQGLTWARVTDGASILFNCDTDTTDNYLTFHVTDDENVNFKWTKNVSGTLLTLGTWKREGIRLGVGSFIGNLTGNADTTTRLATSMSIWGQSFNGSANVSGDMTNVANISMSGNINMTSGEPIIKRNGENIIRVADAGLVITPYSSASGFIALRCGDKTNVNGSTELRILANGNVGIGMPNPAYRLDVNGTARATSLHIGNATLSWDSANNALKIDGNVYATGGVSALGASGVSGGSSGSLFGLMKSWPTSAPSSTTTDALGANLGYELHTRVKSLEGGSATSITTTGSGNAITAISKSGTVITATKGATFLTAHQSLANYVTLNTAQSISGAKTFTNELKVQSKVTFLSEAKLKMWNVTSTRNSVYGAEMVFVQTSIDSADPETTWPDKNRNDLFFQPKGGHVHIGPIETAQNNTLYVAGDVKATSGITAASFSKSGSSDSYFLLGGGGHKALSDYYTKSEVNTKLTDGSVTKLGTATVGNSSRPVYLNGGVPTAGSYTFGNASGNAAVNNGTVNTNLNADMLDGVHASGLFTALSNNASNNLSITVGGTTRQLRVGAIGAYEALTVSKNDNGGRSVYLLIADVTTWYGTTSSDAADTGIIGYFYGRRGGNMAGTSVQKIIAWCTHNNTLYRLQTDTTENNAILPRIVKYNNKYYLALYMTGSGRDHYFIGTKTANLLTSFITVNSDTSGQFAGLTVVHSESGMSHYGNASTATTLATARTINGTSFNGSANITTSYWGTARNISIADSTSAHTGAATSVNGSGDVTLKLPATIAATSFVGALSGNATTATTLQTSRTLWGQSFNGGANVSGNMTGVGNIDMTGNLRLKGSANFGNKINFGDGDFVYLHEATDDVLTLYASKGINLNSNTGTIIHNVDILPSTSNTRRIGSSTINYAGVHSRQLINNTSNPLWIWQASNDMLGFATNGIEWMRLSPSGYVGINTKTPSARLHVVGDIAATGGITALSNSSTSDMRLKRVIRDITLDIRQIAGAPSFIHAWKDAAEYGGGEFAGSSAQYWLRVLPQAVSGKQWLALDYGKTALLSAIALARRSETHEQRISRLEKENEQLREQIRQIKNSIF